MTQTASGTLGELLLTFSTVTSSGLGVGSEHGIRTCYLSMALAADLELPPAQCADLYYAALAKDGGCICGATQLAVFLGGDEREAIADLAAQAPEDELQLLRWVFRHAGRGAPPSTRARHLLGALIHGARFERENREAECEVAQRLAVRLGLSEQAALALVACTERWDGKGQPQGLAGDAIPLVARIVNLCSAVEIADRLSGRSAALALVRHRSGKAFDPHLATAFMELAARDDVWAPLDEDDESSLRMRVLGLDPEPTAAGADAVDRLCEVLADLMDMKQPALAGHARRVQQLAASLGERAGIHAGEHIRLRRAALVHELGQLTLSRPTLDRGVDDAAYRSHPLAVAPLLAALPALDEVVALAALHHERLDGSGWPAGMPGSRQPLPARILALACALDEATGAGDTSAGWRALSQQPGFDRSLLDACADLLGTPRAARSDYPAGLTGREVEVLRLGAKGMSVREIARSLVLSHHTVRHHLESAYGKIGCSNRAAASLFAAEHGLLQ